VESRFTEIRKEALAVLRSPKRRWGVELLVYVGGFGDNAFTFAQEGQITAAIPI
jgi:hypothetical protein